MTFGKKGKTHLKETKEKISSQVSRKVKGFLNGKELSFDSVLLCKEYFELHYGVSHKFIQKIINSETPYISTREKTKVLHGLVLEKYNFLDKKSVTKYNKYIL